MSTIPLTRRGAEKLKDELQRLKIGRAPCRDPGHRRGARAGRPVGERRVRGRQGQAGLHRRPHPGDRGQAGGRAGHRPGARWTPSGRVVFGATVDLEDETSGAKVTYQIVGDDEADLKLGLISISSPIARALIGKEAGDVAEVQAPGGLSHYEIIERALPLMGLQRWRRAAARPVGGHAAVHRAAGHAGAVRAAAAAPRRAAWSARMLRAARPGSAWRWRRAAGAGALAARRAWPQRQGSQFSAGMLLALGAVFCTVAGYFALQPMMPAARAGQGRLSFGQLHAVSAVLLRRQGAAGAGCWPGGAAGASAQSAAFFLTLVDARLGALDLAAGGDALVAEAP